MRGSELLWPRSPAGAGGRRPPGRRALTVFPGPEGGRELSGSDSGDACLLLGLLCCGERRLRLGPGVGSPGRGRQGGRSGRRKPGGGPLASRSHAFVSAANLPPSGQPARGPASASGHRAHPSEGRAWPRTDVCAHRRALSPGEPQVLLKELPSPPGSCPHARELNPQPPHRRASRHKRDLDAAPPGKELLGGSCARPHMWGEQVAGRALEQEWGRLDARTSGCLKVQGHKEQKAPSPAQGGPRLAVLDTESEPDLPPGPRQPSSRRGRPVPLPPCPSHGPVGALGKDAGVQG